MQGHSVAGNSRELSVTSQEVESCPWSPPGPHEPRLEYRSLPGHLPGRGENRYYPVPPFPGTSYRNSTALRLLYSPAGWC